MPTVLEDASAIMIEQDFSGQLTTHSDGVTALSSALFGRIMLVSGVLARSRVLVEVCALLVNAAGDNQVKLVHAQTVNDMLTKRLRFEHAKVVRVELHDGHIRGGLDCPACETAPPAHVNDDGVTECGGHLHTCIDVASHACDECLYTGAR